MEEPFAPQQHDEDRGQAEVGTYDAPLAATGGAFHTQQPPRDRGAQRTPTPAYQLPQTAAPASRPFSRTTVALLCLWMVSAALLAMSAGLTIAHGGWGAGVLGLGIACLGGCLVCLLGVLLRTLRGRRGRGFLLAALAATIALGSLGGLSLLTSHSMQRAQGHYFEARREWSRAARAYQMSGEAGPDSPDTSRTYREWGEASAAQGDFPAAIAALATVGVRYYASGPESATAEADLGSVSRQWLSLDPSDASFAAVIPLLAAYTQSGHCDTRCSTVVGPIEAQALYAYGTRLAARDDIADTQRAIQQFEALLARFGATELGPATYAAAAGAYYQLGQLQQPADCHAAALTFQTLAAEYRMNPEALKAAKALAAPVRVIGVVLPSSGKAPQLMVYLSRTVTGAQGTDLSGAVYSDDYQATPDASGHFTFPAVTQGDYNLSAVFNGDSAYTVGWFNTSPFTLYSIHVSPLCPVDVGTFYYQNPS